jgi:hypothetical protein
MVDKEWHKYRYSLIFNFFSKKKVLEAAGSSPAGPTSNKATNVKALVAFLLRHYFDWSNLYL